MVGGIGGIVCILKGDTAGIVEDVETAVATDDSTLVFDSSPSFTLTLISTILAVIVEFKIVGPKGALFVSCDKSFGPSPFSARIRSCFSQYS